MSTQRDTRAVRLSRGQLRSLINEAISDNNDPSLQRATEQLYTSLEQFWYAAFDGGEYDDESGADRVAELLRNEVEGFIDGALDNF